MNDQDTIRKAVELADGWDSADEQVDCPLGCAFRFPLQTTVLDALAAQLVRQVDALKGPELEIFEDGTYIGREDGDNLNVDSSNRTMNTIKAIVDIGVLE